MGGSHYEKPESAESEINDTLLRKIYNIGRFGSGIFGKLLCRLMRKKGNFLEGVCFKAFHKKKIVPTVGHVCRRDCDISVPGWPDLDYVHDKTLNRLKQTSLLIFGQSTKKKNIKVFDKPSPST